MDYLELISSNIKKLRLKHNLTQEEFAEKIEISVQGLSNIERMRYQPTAQTIDKICKKFKITPSELLCNNMDNSEENITNIVALISECPKAKIKKIYEIIKIAIKL